MGALRRSDRGAGGRGERLLTRARWIAVGAGALGFGLLLAVLRGTPAAGSDQGVYLSIAARLLEGDRLYADVSDPKDPLFFYTYAAALAIWDWRGPFLLDGLWLGVAGISFALLLRELHAPRSAVIAGFFVYPLALTAGWYQAGLSMLGGLALAPLPALLWLRGRYVAAGVLLGAVMLFKLNLAAIAGAALAGFLVLGAPAGSRWHHVTRGVLGLASFLGVAAVVLAARGELRGFFEMIAYNVHYSSSLVDHLGPVGRARVHLDVVVQYLENSGRWQLPATVLVLAVFAVAAVVAWMRFGSRGRALSAAAVLTLVATLGTLALTAYWTHHLQMLAYPAAFVAATLISVVALRLGPRAGAVAAVFCVAFALWASVKNEDRIDVADPWTTPTPHSGGAVALERARVRLHEGDDRVSYAAFGGNSENAHAVFLPDELELVCRWFHLYPESLEAHYGETLACVNREDPELILVTLGFFDSRTEGAPAWSRFVGSARRLLESRYERVEREHPGFEVWARKPVAGGVA